MWLAESWRVVRPSGPWRAGGGGGGSLELGYGPELRYANDVPVPNDEANDVSPRGERWKVGGDPRPAWEPGSGIVLTKEERLTSGGTGPDLDAREGLVPFSFSHSVSGGEPLRGTVPLQNGTPGERCPWRTVPLENGTPGERYPWRTVPLENGTPGERCPWRTVPLQNGALENESPGERCPWRTVPLENGTPGERYPWRTVPLENGTPGERYPWRTVPLENGAPGERCPWRTVLIYVSRGRVAPRYATAALAGLRGDGLVSPDSCSQPPPPPGYGPSVTNGVYSPGSGGTSVSPAALRALGVPACPPQPSGLWRYQRVPLSPPGSGGTSVSPSVPGPRPAGQGPGGLEQSGRNQGRLALINPSAAALRLGYR
ncbi:unnamed protein product [Gadus morhua 'NCC']